jgi:uncharacterized integral membrane protein
MKNAKILITIIVLTLFLIVTLQNTEVATFKILFWHVDMSRIVLIFLSAIIGFITGFIIAKITGGKSPEIEVSDEKEKE